MNIPLQRKLFLLICFLAGSILQTGAQSGETGRPVVTLKEGAVRGSYSKDAMVSIFKGIPYAAPPTGALRWKAPRPVQPWKKTLDCSEFPASAMQGKPVPFMMWSEEFISPPEPLSEDCLYLNVWTSGKAGKAGEAGKKMPVFVWIHGGGFVSGSGACAVYDGESMARDGIVFISLNYRLGAFGFLSFPDQEKESGNESGNFALLDQIAALKWIRQNVAAFGGDPDQITIGGQSAGSMCVNALVASPLAKGLFRAAIAQSGVLINNNFTRDRKAASELGAQMLAAVGAKSLQEARKIPADKILEAAAKLPFRSFTPYMDGYLLPAPVGKIIAEGQHNKVPLLIGWVNRDGDLVQPGRISADSFRQQIRLQYPQDSQEFLSVFPADNDSIATASRQKLGLIQFAAAQSLNWAKWNRNTAYVYHFGYVPTDKPGFPNYGAFHTSEVPFALENLSKWNRPWQAADLAVEKTMSAYWKNFIKTGNPNGPGVPEWREYNVADGNVMNIDKNPALQRGFFRKEIQLLENIQPAGARAALTDGFPVRAFSISAPNSGNLDSFIVFIQKELAPRKVNTLILRVDYSYQYKSHPELVGKEFLTEQQVKKLVHAARGAGISIIPQINLLGHQSWAGTTGKLLEVYPQFDETPWVEMPEKYVWPNKDGLYCKSYCSLHPDVHKIVFELVDEICDVFEANAFHAGMDEVFYIGEEKCPRCGGLDKAELFAGELTKIRNHLAGKGRQLWIWGDRLIDGKTTGIGMWEGSHNNTHRAIDLIPKDVVICDWHYERADKTAVYFAMKGFSVITCSWNRPAVARQQVQDMHQFRKTATPAMKERYLGIMETIWSPVSSFLNGFYGNLQEQPGKTTMSNTPWHTFQAMFEN